MTVTAKFEIKYQQYMDENGVFISNDTSPAFAQNIDTLKQLYRDMSLIRTLDTKAYALQRTGKMGTYPAATGQEAIGVGFGSVMTRLVSPVNSSTDSSIVTPSIKS